MNEHMNSIVESIDAIAKQRDEARAERDELRNERDMAAARVMAFERGRCPGIPLDDGNYSGCEGGGDDCPVCKGQTFDAQAQCNKARAEVVMLREELGLGLGDAMQRVASLAREVIDLRQERDEMRAAVRAYFAVDGSEGTWSAVEAHAARERLRALLGGAS